MTFKKIDENQPIIPDWWFEERSKAIFKLTCCRSNKHGVKEFINRIGSFTVNKIMFLVLRSTRNIRSLFPLKDKVANQSYVIYQGPGSRRSCWKYRTCKALNRKRRNVMEAFFVPLRQPALNLCLFVDFIVNFIDLYHLNEKVTI